MNNPMNPIAISAVPSRAVLRNPHFTIKGAASNPLHAHVSMIGVTTPAAAAAPPPRPPCT